MEKKRYVSPETELLTLDRGPVLLAASPNTDLKPGHDNETYHQGLDRPIPGPTTGGDEAGGDGDGDWNLDGAKRGSFWE